MSFYLHRSVAVGPERPLEVTAELLKAHQSEDHFAYERGDTWYIGLHAYSALLISPDGQKVTQFGTEGMTEFSVNGSIKDVARAFTSKHSPHGKIFGYVGFNYSAHTSGQTYTPGTWPLLNLIVPRIYATISRNNITVSGVAKKEVSELFDWICTRAISNIQFYPQKFVPIDLNVNCEDFKRRVERAIDDIKDGKYTKAIPSRVVTVPSRVDMPGTLVHGRRANTPARTFVINHMGNQAVGFSPEVVLSVDGQTLFTEAVAGTQRSDEKPIVSLLDDPKEVVEHCIAVKGSIRGLNKLCSSESVSVKNFMTLLRRGNVNHLFSHVTGTMTPDKDGWDALSILLGNVTVPGLAGQKNMDAIQTFEPQPRDLYCGAALMIDVKIGFFEATLALRTIFQDSQRQWLQAGAGVTAQSNPEREFVETCEKLESMAPYVVAHTSS